MTKNNLILRNYISLGFAKCKVNKINVNNIIIPLLYIGKVLAVDLMSSVKVDKIVVLLEPTRKKKKSLISRMFDLESELKKCVYY